MSRARFNRARVDLSTSDGPLSIIDLRRAGVRVDDLLAACGLTPRVLESYLGGERRPAGWMAREIAGALRVEPSELWPPTHSEGLRRGSFDDRAGRRASGSNVGGGVSRGAR